MTLFSKVHSICLKNIFLKKGLVQSIDPWTMAFYIDQTDMLSFQRIVSIPINTTIYRVILLVFNFRRFNFFFFLKLHQANLVHCQLTNSRGSSSSQSIIIFSYFQRIVYRYIIQIFHMNTNFFFMICHHFIYLNQHIKYFVVDDKTGFFSW